jgi:hypothetical protein
MNNQYFEKLIFKHLGQDPNFDRLKHNLLNIRESMLKRHKDFKLMSIKKQFEYCNTIGVIVVHTQLQTLNENMPLSLPKDNYYKYSIDRNFKKIKLINL